MDALFAFIKNFKNLNFEDLPEEVISATKKTFLDTIGVAVAGSTQKGPKEICEIVAEWDMKGTCSVIGCKRKLPAPYAAQINATMIHACDYDDVHEKAIMHPSVIAVPSALAASEVRGGIDGKEFICALAMGTDMICRLSLALTINPITTGFHMTTVFGHLVSALIAGRILKLDEEEMVNALGIAYHQCGGNGQAVKDGALTKRMGPGFAVRAGIMACFMAKKGLTGARNCLEGEWGLYRVYFKENYDPKVLTDKLGSYFESVNVSIKPYPCCRGTHASIDAALELKKKHGIETEQIEKVIVYTGEANHMLLCTPAEKKCRPENPVDTQFSIPWGVAVGLSKGKMKMEYFSEQALWDKEILYVAEKTETYVEPNFSRTKGDEPAMVKILTKDGKTFSATAQYPYGSPQNPMSFEKCVEKFRDCIAFSGKAIPEEKMKIIIDKVYELEKIKDINELIGLLRG